MLVVYTALMIRQLSTQIGLRYAGLQNTRGFAAVISYVAMIAMALGVLSLLTVLSVMNGFRGEFRDRLLQVVPHIAVESSKATLSADTATLVSHPSVLATAPFVEGSVMVRYRGYDTGASLVGVDLALEQNVAPQSMLQALAPLADEKFGVAIGSGIARILGIEVGDQIKILLPQLTVTPAGVFPRSKTVKVVSIFTVGAQTDATHMYMRFNSAQKLLGVSGKPNIRLVVDDVEAVVALADQLSQQTGASTRTWRSQYQALFDAMAMEKLVVGVMLTAIILVAAFNITSLLAMGVAQKRGSIAVLRMMGASKAQVLKIFWVQGTLIGVAGIGAGLLLGIPLSLFIGAIVGFFESLVGNQVFDANLYYVSSLPSDLQLGDVAWVVLFAFFVASFAALLPARRAAKIAPAEALRYE